MTPQLYLENSFSISPYTRTFVPGNASNRSRHRPPYTSIANRRRYTPPSDNTFDRK